MSLSWVMFNADKHHLVTMYEKIQRFKQEVTLEVFLEQLVFKGIHRKTYNGVIDIYCGALSVTEIKTEVSQFLLERKLEDPLAYQNYLKENGQIKRIGYYMPLVLSDTSEYTLRVSDSNESFAHIHPGRLSPNTFRIKANTLKTAQVTFFLHLSQKTPWNLNLINEARKQLNLSPVTDKGVAIYEMIEKFASLEQ